MIEKFILIMLLMGCVIYEVFKYFGVVMGHAAFADYAFIISCITLALVAIVILLGIKKLRVETRFFDD